MKHNNLSKNGKFVIAVSLYHTKWKRADGSLCYSKRRETLIAELKTVKAEIQATSAMLKDCPERIEITNEDEKFMQIEVDGKNYWDLAQGLAWNSRKKMINIFCEFLPNQLDLIPVLDAITQSHVWIRSTDKTVEILLEPMEIPRFQAAQIQLCCKINWMSIKLYNGKHILYGVAPKPETVQKNDSAICFFEEVCFENLYSFYR